MHCLEFRVSYAGCSGADTANHPHAGKSVQNDCHMPTSEIIGLVPAAGFARRVSPLPCSKEIYPVRVDFGNTDDAPPKVAGRYLLDTMREGGITRAFVILRDGKWDIPSYFGDGQMVDMHLGYLTTRGSGGVPFTLDTAYPFVRDHPVVMGFPDVILTGDDIVERLTDRLQETPADVVLGLWQARTPRKADMVARSRNGTVRDIVIKPPESSLTHTWMIAAWSPEFTRFLHDYVEDEGDDSHRASAADGELHIGAVIREAVGRGLQVDSVVYEEGDYLDIGTPDCLRSVTTTVEGTK